MTATLRYRGDKSNLLEFAKNLDAFKKVPEKYTETTEIGGTREHSNLHLSISLSFSLSVNVNLIAFLT